MSGLGSRESLRAVDRRRARTKRRALAEGTWRPFTDPEPVRAHVEYLCEAGLNLALVARFADVAHSTLSRLIYPACEGCGGKLSTSVANRILAVTPDTVALPDHAYVPAIGSVRRLQALAVNGWTLAWVAQQIGTSADMTRPPHRRRPRPRHRRQGSRHPGRIRPVRGAARAQREGRADGAQQGVGAAGGLGRRHDRRPQGQPAGRPGGGVRTTQSHAIATLSHSGDRVMLKSCKRRVGRAVKGATPGREPGGHFRQHIAPEPQTGGASGMFMLPATSIPRSSGPVSVIGGEVR